MNIKHVLISLAVIFTIHGPAFAADTSPYQSLPPEKSLKSSPQFYVIDDFNSGQLSGDLERAWKSDAAGRLSFAVDAADARNPERGHSLKTSLTLPRGQAGALEYRLGGVDVSRAEALVFRYRFVPKLPEQRRLGFKVELIDGQRESRTADYSGNLDFAGNWAEAVIPMDRFKDLDRDRLDAIAFSFQADGEPVHGEFWIDEIAFFGAGDVAFESNRDNLEGYPEQVENETRRKELLATPEDHELLKKIAEDTWKYFEKAYDRETRLIVDHIRTGEGPLAADYTSPTNIAMDLMAAAGAVDLGILSKRKAKNRVGRVLDTLEVMSRHKGFFYNFYNTKKLNITRFYLSSVDSGWLAIALVVVRQAFGGDIAERATALLDEMDFEEFLDPENNQLVVGFEVPSEDPPGYHYGMLASEARATSLLAVGKGDVSPEHWWFLFRTPPKAWGWQNQKPKGDWKSAAGIDYFQGHYEYEGRKFVPSWGGSLFEILMPTLVLKERELAPGGLGLNDRVVTELHRDYALKERGYPVWGISPASMSNGRGWQYREFGIKALSVKGYPDQSVITPHVSFLALDSLPGDAIRNIRRLLEFEGIYGEYGLYDSIHLRTGRVNPQYLALDQGMTFVALANYLSGGKIQARFHQDSIGKNAEHLLMKESFFSE